MGLWNRQPQPLCCFRGNSGRSYWNSRVSSSRRAGVDESLPRDVGSGACRPCLLALSDTYRSPHPWGLLYLSRNLNGDRWFVHTTNATNAQQVSCHDIELASQTKNAAWSNTAHPERN